MALPTKKFRQILLVGLLVASACGDGEGGQVTERLAHRLLDELGEARVELGAIPPDDAAPVEQTLLGTKAGVPLDATWVAFDSAQRPRSEPQGGDRVLLRDSACTIIEASAQQVMHLTARMAPAGPLDPPGPGQQQVAGTAVAIELDARPASIEAGCRTSFLVPHLLATRFAEPRAAGELPEREVSFTTMTQTRAVAVVLATELLITNVLAAQVVQRPAVSAVLGDVRLARRDVTGISRARFLELFPPDPLAPHDPRRLRAKPALGRQVRDAALAPPGTSLCWSTDVPSRASLRFGLGVAWDVSTAQARPVRFAVRAGARSLFEEEVPPGRQGWRDRRVDLRGLEGRRELCLETSAPPGGEGVSWPLWAAPEITALAADEEGARPRTVVLVSVDTLRADRLGLYGYDAATSPVLDRLAEDSLVFEGHVAQTGWTLPSHVSMLTGLAPEAHGVTGQMERIIDLFDVGFDPTVPTLAAAFRDAGYSTQGVVSAPYLEPAFGFDRGFDVYDVSTVSSHLQSHSDVTAPRITGLARQIIGRSGRRPLFLFLHYWDVHYDYIPPRDDLAAVHPDRATLDYDEYRHPYTRRDNPALLHLIVTAGLQNTPREFYRRMRQLLPGYPRVQDLVRGMSDLYDGEIRSVDRHLGLVLEELRRAGRDDPVVVVTGDHGESFMEHGSLAHGVDNIHHEGLVVPLIVHAPGRVEPGRRTDAGSTIDTSATLLDLVGLPPLERAQGRSLRRPGAAPRLVVGHDGEFSRVQATLGRYRLLSWTAFGADELFDLQTDPEERTDVGDRLPERRAELRRALAAYLLERGRGVHVAVAGGEAPRTVDVTLEADEPLRPAFVYGPPGAGAMSWESDQRVLRLQALPAQGETVALTVLAPNDLPVRLRVTQAGAPVPADRVLGPDGAPLASLTSDSSWNSTRDEIPPALRGRTDAVMVWRTPAYSVRVPLAPQQETLEQLRALGYLRD